MARAVKKIPLHTAPAGPIGPAKPLAAHVLAPAAGAGAKRVPPHVAAYPAGTKKKNVPPHTKAYSPARKKAEPPGGKPDYVPAFRFRVSVQVGDELIRIGFSKITGISASIHTQVLQEGGVNDRVYLLPENNGSEGKLTFENGLVYSEGQKTPSEKLEKYLRPGRRMDTVLIEIYGFGGKVSRMCMVEDAVVSQWSLRDLDAMSGQLGIQQFEISYGRLVYA